MSARPAAWFVALVALALLASVLVACVRANAQAPQGSSSSTAPAETTATRDAAASEGTPDHTGSNEARSGEAGASRAGTNAARFLSYDLHLDSGAFTLAAWQVEIVDPTNKAMIVAVEGGQHLAFSAPPHYDPRALMHGRIVLAAFSTSDTLPEGSSRVARIHVAVEGDQDPKFELRVQAAADREGATIRVRSALVRS